MRPAVPTLLSLLVLSCGAHVTLGELADFENAGRTGPSSALDASPGPDVFEASVDATEDAPPKLSDAGPSFDASDASDASRFDASDAG